MEQALEEVRDLDNGVTFGLFLVRGRLAGSSGLIEFRYAGVSAWRDGLIERVTSKFPWAEQQLYEGADGAQTFLDDWTDAWEDWEFEVEAVHDTGDKVVAVARQRGRAKATGMPFDMSFAKVWSVREGKLTRMEMYADPAEAVKATG
jgi:ketosteroid isomerase-like protein